MLSLVKFLNRNLAYLVWVYTLIQIIYIIFSRVEYRSDSYNYYRLAQEYISNNTFYPADFHLYEEYIAERFPFLIVMLPFAAVFFDGIKPKAKPDLIKNNTVNGREYD